ncbi:YncE family protein [Halovenus rubra]|uniref:YncE family protein n=2 Tax=Halovenus rubra TaxID=869890 RepID=A0ABD5XEN6_9EURY|nr:cell surface protein [Halovenus rubra]
MVEHASRRAFLAGAAGVSLFCLSGCLTTTDEGYEVWSVDSGTNSIYIHEAHSEPNEETVEFDEVGSIDTGAENGTDPNTITFSTEYEYAVVSCPGSGRTLVYRTEDSEQVANLETGANTRFASFTPNDNAILVDVAGESKIVRIDVDFEEEVFEVSDERSVDESVEGLGSGAGVPGFHTYTQDGRSVHTLGPRYRSGGVVIVDYAQLTVETAFSSDVLPATGDAVPHPTAEKMFLTAGSSSSTTNGSIGEYYVLDTDTNELIDKGKTAGADPKSVRLSPDGTELWILNSKTNDGVVVDAETNEVIDKIGAVGPKESETAAKRDTRCNLRFSPDGQYAFVTLRGPAQRVEGQPVSSGVTPGIAVLDVTTRELRHVVEPDPLGEYSDTETEATRSSMEGKSLPDFRGLNVRPTDDFDGYSVPPYGNTTN